MRSNHVGISMSISAEIVYFILASAGSVLAFWQTFKHRTTLKRILGFTDAVGTSVGVAKDVLDFFKDRIEQLESINKAQAIQITELKAQMVEMQRTAEMAKDWQEFMAAWQKFHEKVLHGPAQKVVISNG